MKIVYFAPTSTLYGDNIALLNILKVLSLKDLSFLIITSREGDFTSKLRELGFNYCLCRFDDAFWPSISSIRDFTFFIPRIFVFKLYRLSCFYTNNIKSVIREFNPDIIHSNNSCFKLGVKIANELNIPHVQHIREYGKLDIGKSYFPSISHYVYSVSKPNDLVLCITKDVKRCFLKDRNLQNWHVVYDGVIDNEYFFIPDKEPYFLYVGRLFPGKGVLELINKYALFIHDSNSNIRLKIVGDGSPSYKCKLKQSVVDNKIENMVDFLGYCSDVYSLMSKALALFVPSFFEGFGFITVEAMSCGCLVVGRNTGGTKEQFDYGLLLEKNEIGLRFDADDELVPIMEDLSLNGINQYYSIIKRAQEVVRKSYTIELCASRIYKYYNEILKSSRNC